MNEFLFCLAVVGITSVLVDGAIFEPLRLWLASKLDDELYYLTGCYQCMGTWVGFFTGLVLMTGFWGMAVTLCLSILGFIIGWVFLRKIHSYLVLATSGFAMFLGACFTTENAFLVLLSGGAGAFIAPLGYYVLKYFDLKIMSMESIDVGPGNESLGYEEASRTKTGTGK